MQLKLPGFQTSGRYKVQPCTEETRQRAEEDQSSSASISTVQPAEITAINTPLLWTDKREDALSSNGQSIVNTCFMSHCVFPSVTSGTHQLTAQDRITG